MASTSHFSGNSPVCLLALMLAFQCLSPPAVLGYKNEAERSGGMDVRMRNNVDLARRWDRRNGDERSPKSLEMAGNGSLFKFFACPAFLLPGKAVVEAGMFQHPEEWSTVIEQLTDHHGAYHFHDFLLNTLGPGEASIVANFFKQHPNLSVSIEAGTYLCNGTDVALQQLAGLHNYTAAGGRIDQWALESIFSRTIHGCEGKFSTFAQVAEQAVDYVIQLRKAMPHLQFGVIDAVPHFTAGKYPANQPSVALGDIRDALSTLKKALADIGTDLLFYWADCPYEYSLHIPNNEGFKKLAFIANYTTNELGIRMGKIFNSQLGGNISDQSFHDRTLMDYQQYMAAVPASDTSDVIVESWYKHPQVAIPETQPYTFMYTAKAVFDLASNMSAAEHPNHLDQLERNGDRLQRKHRLRW